METLTLGSTLHALVVLISTYLEVMLDRIWIGRRNRGGLGVIATNLKEGMWTNFVFSPNQERAAPPGPEDREIQNHDQLELATSSVLLAPLLVLAHRD